MNDCSERDHRFTSHRKDTINTNISLLVCCCVDLVRSGSTTATESAVPPCSEWCPPVMMLIYKNIRKYYQPITLIKHTLSSETSIILTIQYVFLIFIS